MDAVRVALLREVLAGTEWLGATRRFAGQLRASVSPPGSGGLLLVGTRTYEPWHLAAHLMDEAAWSGLPTLAPTLVRHEVGPHDPAHLSVGLGRLEAAGRGETLLVVGAGGAGPEEALLERVHDVRRAGATVLALTDDEAGELSSLAHELLVVPQEAEVDLDTVQHLVSAAAGENAGRAPGNRGTRFRDRAARLGERLVGPPPERW
ncbi:hypothetical protein [Streptomyces sp. NPDC054863]